MKIMRVLAVFMLMFLVSASLFAQDGFGFGLGLGTRALESTATGVAESWNQLSLRPNIDVGKFGIGLDVNINFSFAQEDGSPGFRIREEDWVPTETRTFFDLYLPLIRYLRFGEKGDDFYAAIGTIDNFLLGNGFIMSGYSNTQFLPEQRVSGFSFDLDANVFDFPYLGIETVIGNLAALDILGGRIYTRPIYWTNVPAIQDLQVGFTAVLDRDPFYYEKKAISSDYAAHFDAEENVVVFGVDLRLPLFAEEAVKLALFSDLVFQNENIGFMAGFGGKLFDFLTYGAQVRVLEQNFTPNYFDTHYDLYRAQQWEIYKAGKASVLVPAYSGWLASLGIDVIDSQILLNVTLGGPFEPDVQIDQLNSTLSANLHLDPKLLAGFGLDLSYQKKFIKKIEDIISPENAVIRAAIGFDTGDVNIAMIYDLKYNPTPSPTQVDGNGDPQYWQVSTRFETSFSF